MEEIRNYSIFNRHWLTGKYYPRVGAFYFKEWKDFDMKFHFHRQAEIMYVIKGSCVVETCGRVLNMKDGDLIFIDSEIEHKLTVGRENSCRMLNIEFCFEENQLPVPSLEELVRNVEAVNFMISNKEKFFLLKDHGDIYTVLKSCIIELDKNYKDSEFLQQMLLAEVLIKLSQVYKENFDRAESGYSIHIKKAQDYIACNYDYDISVKDIADHVNVHPGYLHRIFKKSTGIAIMQYINDLRLEKAKMLLKNTDIPVTLIASYVGINSLQYFEHVFKSKTGLTPLKYRKSPMDSFVADKASASS